MKRFVDKLARKRWPNEKAPYSDAARADLGALEGWVSIVSNTLMALAKALLATLSGSLSLMADAVHTFADSLTSLVVIVGFRMAGKPADDEHPFGHARIESIATLIIGVLLAVAAVELGRAAVERLLEPAPVEAPVWMIVTVFAMAVLKEVMARFSFVLGELIGSCALEADAWHHRSDVLATMLVVLAFIASRIGLHWLDGVAGIGVAFIVAFAAYRIVSQAAQPLIGEKLSESEIRRISEIAGGVKGVHGVHGIVVHRFGAFQVMSLHVEVSRALSVMEAHDIGQAVETRLEEELGAHATVHIDPKGTEHPESRLIEEIVKRELDRMDGLLDIHDLRVETKENGLLRVGFEIRTKKEIGEETKQEYLAALKDSIRARFSGATVDIRLTPPFCRAASDATQK